MPGKTYAYDAVILTDHRYVNPTEKNTYIRNVLMEDGLLKQALESRGLKVGRVSWDDPGFDWSSAEYVIFRTTWDYFERYDEFSAWLQRTSRMTSMINTFETIRWNMDKHYLQDLSSKNINIPPTLFIEPGEDRPLAEIIRETGWDEVILKPAVSGGAWHTYRLDRDNVRNHESIFRELIGTESMLLQEFQRSVLTEGELALMLFGGRFSHAVLKMARSGDFRVQDDFGGSVNAYEPSLEEIRFAEEVVSACDPVPVYARVDVLRDNHGRMSLTELELIEPELWFRICPDAADLCAGAFTDFIS